MKLTVEIGKTCWSLHGKKVGEHVFIQHPEQTYILGPMVLPLPKKLPKRILTHDIIERVPPPHTAHRRLMNLTSEMIDRRLREFHERQTVENEAAWAELEREERSAHTSNPYEITKWGNNRYTGPRNHGL